MEGKKGHWRIFFFDKFSTASKLLRVTQNDHRWSQAGQAKPGQTNPNIRIQITLWGNPSSTVSHMFSDLSPFDLHLMFKIPPKRKAFLKRVAGARSIGSNVSGACLENAQLFSRGTQNKQSNATGGRSERGSQIEYAAVTKRCVSHEAPAVRRASAHPH